MSEAFSPSGIITITTDFGHKGPFVGTMKGMMLRGLPQAQIVDLTHEIYVHWPAEASFWLGRAYHYFPPGTVHVAVVDPGVGTERDVLVMQYDGHAFLAPDNGLLGRLADAHGARVYRLDPQMLSAHGIGTPSATFHGRDLFAPLAALLAGGQCRMQDLGALTEDVVPCWLEDPVVQDGKISGTVVTVDGFGNLITNIDQQLLSAFGQLSVLVGGHRMGLRRTYGHATPGDLLALVNSFDVLEIACAEGDAAERLGLGRGAPVIVTAC